MKNDIEILKVAERYGLSLDDIKRNLINDNCTVTLEELDNLYKLILEKREILKNIMMEPFEIEGEVSSLKFQYYLLLKQCESLSIKISGLLSHNRTLRKIKKLKSMDDKEIEKLIEKYMFSLRRI
ncbi:MAG: hypothetical protein QXG60_01075 [Thermoplasmata archaeon]|nr:hypothetical protein [Staphylococcus epidermidis]